MRATSARTSAANGAISIARRSWVRPRCASDGSTRAHHARSHPPRQPVDRQRVGPLQLDVVVQPDGLEDGGEVVEAVRTPLTDRQVQVDLRRGAHGDAVMAARVQDGLQVSGASSTAPGWAAAALGPSARRVSASTSGSSSHRPALIATRRSLIPARFVVGVALDCGARAAYG